MMRNVNESDESCFAAAVAASANAIHFLEGGNRGQVQPRKANTRQREPLRAPSQVAAGFINKPPTRDVRASSFHLSFTEGRTRKKVSRGENTSLDAWEKAKIAKIRKRYEKIHEQIQSWENEKKLRQKHKMERKKEEIELRMSTNLKHYYIKVARINDIARDAKAQAEKKQKHEEFIVREKVRMIRPTGKLPKKYFFCF